MPARGWARPCPVSARPSVPLNRAGQPVLGGAGRRLSRGGEPGRGCCGKGEPKNRPGPPPRGRPRVPPCPPEPGGGGAQRCPAPRRPPARPTWGPALLPGDPGSKSQACPRKTRKMRPLFDLIFFREGCWQAVIYIISLLKCDLFSNWRLPCHFLWQHHRVDRSGGAG